MAGYSFGAMVAVSAGYERAEIARIVAVALPLTLAAPSLAGITAVLAVVGAGFGQHNVAMFQLIDEVVSPDLAVEAFTWLTTWQGLGVAVGAAAVRGAQGIRTILPRVWRSASSRKASRT